MKGAANLVKEAANLVKAAVNLAREAVSLVREYQFVHVHQFGHGRSNTCCKKYNLV